MRRGAKPARAKSESKVPGARKSGKGEGSRVGDLEERLAEALEQQTATAEILSVISTSPTNLQPVLDAVVKSAARFCGAPDASLFRLEGEGLRADAHHGPVAQPRGFLVPVVRGSVAGRSVLERRAVGVTDLQGESEEFPEGSALARQTGQRATLSVPLLREGAPIGVILLRRADAVPFTDKQIALLQIFADQAVIAIENVRLFNETKEALEQQTATSSILRAIAASPNDLRPVFETILRSARELCGGFYSLLFLCHGEQLNLAATDNVPAEGLDALKQRYPVSIASDDAGLTARAIRERRLQHVTDIQTEPSIPEAARRASEVVGQRAGVAVPLLREGEPVGALTVSRQEARAFSEKERALLQTFADQAVIAIENVRLFKELEAANRELSAASQHKSEFLANMSHELRTPLNAVIGFSEVLSERMFGDLNEKQEEYLKDIHASGQHLLSLINDILDLSKIEAGRMELELADFDLPTAIDNALTLVRERAARRGITLGCEIDERVGMIQGDERKVKQVLLNILSNALKFTPEGGRIDVRTALKEGTVEISVTDTGVGIAPEDQEAIFEEFRQVGTSDKKVEGTGLGLALSRRFVELHGGRIWVQSQEGMGSTFTFTIPVQRADQVIE
jgi:signal transduction histidine kinase